VKNFLEYLNEMNHALMPRHQQHAVEDADEHDRGHSYTTSHDYGNHEYGHREADAYVDEMNKELLKKGYVKTRTEAGGGSVSNVYENLKGRSITVEHHGDGKAITNSNT
jgi:hypothetical protein